MKPSNDKPAQPGPSVVVADDNPDNLKVLAGILEELDCEVRPARDGELALNSIRAQPPDLVLLDIHMPKLDGYDTCAALKADPKLREIPVIFVSALTESFNKRKGFELGAVDYITKPFDTTEVQARVRLQLRLRGAMHDLAAAREAAEKASAIKSLFLANMSHEVRTPLHAIIGYSQLLQRSRNLDSEDREFLKVIRSNGEYLLTLIENVFEMSKINTGHMELHQAGFDLHSLLGDLEAMVRNQTSAKGLAFEVNRPDTLPRMVIGDEKKLRQILANLLMNAVKFTEHGGVVMRVSVVETEEDTALWSKGAKEATTFFRFEVEDTGIGIPPDRLTQILTRPDHHPSSGDSGGGSRMGLTIGQEFTRLMGGELYAESGAGHGSIFRLFVPLQVVSSEELGAAVLAPPRLKPDRVGRLALVVEDEKSHSDLLLRLLGEAGFDARSANSGREAVKLFEQLQPRLVLMDFTMPDAKGSALIERLRSLPGGDQAIVVVVTASVTEEEPARLLELGADEVMHKPFSEVRLFGTLRRCFAGDFIEDSEALTEGETSAPSTTASVTEIRARLSPELTAEMRAATLNGDMERLSALIAQLPSQDEPLARQLRQLANAFEYDLLLEVLKPDEEQHE